MQRKMQNADAQHLPDQIKKATNPATKAATKPFWMPVEMAEPVYGAVVGPAEAVGDGD